MKRLLVGAACVCAALLASSPMTVAQTGEPPESPGSPGPKSVEALPSLPILTWMGDQINPALAHSRAAHRYLVVWEDTFAGGTAEADIGGRWVANNGSLLGGGFYVASEGTHGRHRPALAYNANAGEFLVVYEYDYSATDIDIRARRVLSNGVVAAGEIGVAFGTSKETRPYIVHNPADNQYLVVWQQWVGDPEFGHSDIYGRRLDADGLLVGGVIPIKVSDKSKVTPIAAYYTSLHQYGVMWVDRSLVTYPRLYEQRFSAAGAKVGPEYNSTGFGANFNPDMVYSAEEDAYVFVFENKSYGTPDRMDVYVHLDSLAHGTGFGSPIDVQSDKDQSAPDVAYNAAGRSYAIVWEVAYGVADHDIYMKLYRPLGTHACCASIGPVVVTNFAAWEGNPAVASSDGPTSLVVWEDGRTPANGMDLYAAVIRHGSVDLPLVRR